MVLPTKPPNRQTSAKVSSLELHRIIEARKNLDGVTTLAQYAAQYKSLGWSPVVLDAHTGTDRKLDFSQPQSTWLNLLMDLALKKTRICLAVRLEPDSPLFVLKVNPVFGKAFLDDLGDWRSPCVARAGDIWEHHFLLLPPDRCLSPGNLDHDKDAPLSVIGSGGVVVVPPSLDQTCHETWHWLQPPWEQPPRHPAPRLLLLLEEAGYIFSNIPKVAEPAGSDEAVAAPSPTPEPEDAATSPYPETLWNELRILADLTLELEEQVEKLERQQVAAEGGAAPSGPMTMEELQKLSRALEEFLLKNPALLDEE